MSKYTDEFKLEVVWFYLSSGFGYKTTANKFRLPDCMVKKWVKVYCVHGMNGIRRRPSHSVYSFEFKIRIVRLLLQGNHSACELAIHYNIGSISAPSQWLKQYRQYGIDGLKLQAKGRKSVKKPPQAVKEANHLKTKEELMEELLRDGRFKKARCLNPREASAAERSRIVSGLRQGYRRITAVIRHTGTLVSIIKKSAV